MLHRPNQPHRLVGYADSLQRKLHEMIGFMPRTVISEYWERGQIRPAFQNDQLCGYLLYYDGRNGNMPKRQPFHLHVHQAAIQYDAQRRYHGESLVTSIQHHARKHGFRTIGAWVATDIDANAFWHAMGFVHIATRKGGRRRNRFLNLWMCDVPYSRTSPAPVQRPAVPTPST